MKRKNLYHRVVSVCIILGGVAAWNVLFMPSVPASPAVKSETQDQDMELQEQEMESVLNPWGSFEQNEPLSTPDDNSFDSQSQDESVMDDTSWEEESGLDENVLDEEVPDEEALDEIEGLDNLPDENLEPPPSAE